MPELHNHPPSAAWPLSHSTHPAPAVGICSPPTGSPPFAGPWTRWQKDLLASAGRGKGSAGPGASWSRSLLAAAAGPGRAGIVGTDLPDGLGWTRKAAGSVAECQDLPGWESEVAGAGKGTAWRAAETGAKSKIPGMSRKMLGCGGEVVSVATAAAHLGSAWKTESTGSIMSCRGRGTNPGTRCVAPVHRSSHTKGSNEAFFHFRSLFLKSISKSNL